MRWTERQRAMLREMGVRLWEREPVAAAEIVMAESSDVTVAAPVAREAATTWLAAPPTVAVATAAGTTSAGPQETMLSAADWLFVGEPLDAGAGGAGAGAEAHLLDNMLRAIGLARDAATRGQRASYLSLAERPAAATTTDPDRRERIRRTVEIVRPACIVALGRSAAQALLGIDEPLGNLRGRRHEHAGVAVFVTCPLAFLLRHADEKARAWADLCLAVTATDAARTG